MSINPGLTAEIQKLAPSAVIELFELDATALGGDLLRFHAGTNELMQDLIWQGNTYTRYPVKASGFEFNGTGQLPRPKLQVSNIFSAVTALILHYNDLLGVKVTRRRTLVKFLDAANFSSGVNPTADPTAEFPADVYFIDRKSSEDRDTVEFELCSAFDLAGIQLPRRQVIQNVCIWRYRGAECGYAGPPEFDQNDTPIVSADSPEAKSLLSARNTYWNAQTNYASAQAAVDSTSKQKDVACQYVRLDNRYDGSNFVIIAFGQVTAYWNGSIVSLGSTYSKGDYVSLNSDGNELYRIELWGVNTSSCSSATTAYNTAVSNLNASSAALISAKAAYDSAFAALPPNDSIYTKDRCGKRLTSCSARFGSSAELPYGSFPAAGLAN